MATHEENDNHLSVNSISDSFAPDGESGKKLLVYFTCGLAKNNLVVKLLPCNTTFQIIMQYIRCPLLNKCATLTISYLDIHYYTSCCNIIGFVKLSMSETLNFIGANTA